MKDSLLFIFNVRSSKGVLLFTLYEVDLDKTLCLGDSKLEVSTLSKLDSSEVDGCTSQGTTFVRRDESNEPLDWVFCQHGPAALVAPLFEPLHFVSWRTLHFGRRTRLTVASFGAIRQRVLANLQEMASQIATALLV